MTTKNFEIISQHPNVQVLLNTANQQKSLHASICINPGQIIANFSAGITQSFATYLTIQLSTDTHITLQPDYLQYINHSCNPNVFFDTDTMQLICLRKINIGDELTFFYPSTEWQMSQPFVCNCKSENCLLLINGAAHIDKATLKKYRLTHFIQQMINKKNTV